MRFGQPDVHREHAGLHAEARKEDHEQRQGGLRAEIFAQQGEVGRSADAVQPHEADEQQGESHVHHDHVGQRGAAHFAALGVEQDQQERCDGHQLPEKEKRKSAFGGHYAQHGVEHRRQRGVVQRDVGRGFASEVVREISPRVEHRGDGPDRDDQREQRRKRVHRACVASEEEDVGRPQPYGMSAGKHSDGRCRRPERPRRDDCQRRPHLGLERGGEYQRRHHRQCEK